MLEIIERTANVYGIKHLRFGENLLLLEAEPEVVDYIIQEEQLKITVVAREEEGSYVVPLNQIEHHNTRTRAPRFQYRRGYGR